MVLHKHVVFQNNMKVPLRNNFLTLVWKIKKICHKIEHAIPKNPMFLFFDFVTFWQENDMPTLAPKN
jgi:hypothetical protein